MMGHEKGINIQNLLPLQSSESMGDRYTLMTAGPSGNCISLPLPRATKENVFQKKINIKNRQVESALKRDATFTSP